MFEMVSTVLLKQKQRPISMGLFPPCLQGGNKPAQPQQPLMGTKAKTSCVLPSVRAWACCRTLQNVVCDCGGGKRYHCSTSFPSATLVIRAAS